MKTHLDLRPVVHRKEEPDPGPRAAVLAGAAAHQDPAGNRLPTLTGGASARSSRPCRSGSSPATPGTSTSAELIADQRDILRALQVPEPPGFLQLITAD